MNAFALPQARRRRRRRRRPDGPDCLLLLAFVFSVALLVAATLELDPFHVVLSSVAIALIWVDEPHWSVRARHRRGLTWPPERGVGRILYDWIIGSPD